MLKGKKDRGCLFFPAAPVGQLAIPSTGSWLIPHQWPWASASGRLQAPCPALGLLGCSDWAALIHHHPSRPQTHCKSSQTAATWFYPSHPKCPDPKKNEIPLGLEQLCQECSRGLPAKNMNSSGNALDSLSVFLLPLGFIYLCWFCFDSKPW